MYISGWWTHLSWCLWSVLLHSVRYSSGHRISTIAWQCMDATVRHSGMGAWQVRVHLWLPLSGVLALVAGFNTAGLYALCVAVGAIVHLSPCLTQCPSHAQGPLALSLTTRSFYSLRGGPCPCVAQCRHLCKGAVQPTWHAWQVLSTSDQDSASGQGCLPMRMLYSACRFACATLIDPGAYA